MKISGCIKFLQIPSMPKDQGINGKCLIDIDLICCDYSAVGMVDCEVSYSIT